MLCWFLIPHPTFFFFLNIQCLLQAPASPYGFQMCPCWCELQGSTAFFTGVNCFVVWPYFIVLSAYLTIGIRGTSGFWQSGKTMNATFSYTAHGVLLSVASFSRGHRQRCNCSINSTRHCQTIFRRPENSWHSYPLPTLDMVRIFNIWLPGTCCQIIFDLCEFKTFEK